VEKFFVGRHAALLEEERDRPGRERMSRITSHEKKVRIRKGEPLGKEEKK